MPKGMLRGRLFTKWNFNRAKFQPNWEQDIEECCVPGCHEPATQYNRVNMEFKLPGDDVFTLIHASVGVCPKHRAWADQHATEMAQF